MKQQLMERYMSAVAELAKKFDKYTDSGELLADYQKVSNEVANRTEQLVADLGLNDSCKYINESLKILNDAFLEAAEKTDRIRYESKANEAIEFISNLL
jgi:CHASE3 domain sensor protein